jgi:hypothetical protein
MSDILEMIFSIITVDTILPVGRVVTRWLAGKLVRGEALRK